MLTDAPLSCVAGMANVSLACCMLRHHCLPRFCKVITCPHVLTCPEFGASPATIWFGFCTCIVNLKLWLQELC